MQWHQWLKNEFLKDDGDSLNVSFVDLEVKNEK